MSRAFFAAIVCVFALAAACGDPVHDARVDALGGETPGVPKGPLHRGGQPCLTCHGGDGPGKSGFVVAGTIYRTQTDKTPVERAQVVLTDANGSSIVALTNAAGNFYLVRAQWDPTFPITVNVAVGDIGEGMRTEIAGDGSCAGCHFDPIGPGSVGHVYAALKESDLP